MKNEGWGMVVKQPCEGLDVPGFEFQKEGASCDHDFARIATFARVGGESTGEATFVF